MPKVEIILEVKIFKYFTKIKNPSELDILNNKKVNGGKLFTS